jgi:hypothetical protein
MLKIFPPKNKFALIFFIVHSFYRPFFSMSISSGSIRTYSRRQRPINAVLPPKELQDLMPDDVTEITTDSKCTNTKSTASMKEENISFEHLWMNEECRNANVNHGRLN